MIALICTPWLISVWSWQGAFYLYGAWGYCGLFIGPLRQARGLLPRLNGNNLALRRTALACRRRHNWSSVAAYPRLTLQRMLRSRAVWAVIVAHVCINWSLYLVLSWFPTFINQELGADLQLAGFLALAPTVVSLIMAPVAGVCLIASLRGGRIA